MGASALIANGSIKIKQGHDIGSHLSFHIVSNNISWRLSNLEERFTKDSLIFDDGTSLKADIVVLATGYKNMKVRLLSFSDLQSYLAIIADYCGEDSGEGSF